MEEAAHVEKGDPEEDLEYLQYFAEMELEQLPDLSSSDMIEGMLADLDFFRSF